MTERRPPACSANDNSCGALMTEVPAKMAFDASAGFPPGSKILRQAENLHLADRKEA